MDIAFLLFTYYVAACLFQEGEWQENKHINENFRAYGLIIYAIVWMMSFTVFHTYSNSWEVILFLTTILISKWIIDLIFEAILLFLFEMKKWSSSIPNIGLYSMYILGHIVNIYTIHLIYNFVFNLS